MLVNWSKAPRMHHLQTPKHDCDQTSSTSSTYKLEKLTRLCIFNLALARYFIHDFLQNQERRKSSDSSPIKTQNARTVPLCSCRSHLNLEGCQPLIPLTVSTEGSRDNCRFLAEILELNGAKQNRWRNVWSCGQAVRLDYAAQPYFARRQDINTVIRTHAV